MSDPPYGLTGCPLQQRTASSKPNRLSRRFLQTQQTPTAGKVEPPKSQQSEFKTPTRVPRPRAGGGPSEESPHNDSDLQQDIIWDATSPSPRRLGRRGKKQRAGVVDISEIVSRIAPEHGRPEAAEPTLQQWIGDSAAIPCTPDVQGPKPKKKSPRPNGVDDLLKLAKQFDINMFHQDGGEDEGEGVEDGGEGVEDEGEGVEDGGEGVEDGGEGVEDGGEGVEGEGVEDGGEGVEDEPPSEDRHAWDDLDFLFDGPTQCVSGGLSQVSSTANPSSSAAAANAKDTNDAFEDDWDNDDFLDDSLVFEMTQNPQNFAAPKHCSTQKPASPGRAPVSQSAGEKDQVRGRTTFRLESGPTLPVGRLQTNGSAPKDAQRSRFSSGRPVSVGARCQWTRVEPQNPVHQRTVQSNTATERSCSSRREAPDLLDDDLLAVFSSDPVWDDPADDDLLCEVCDDLENQIRSAETVWATQKPVGHPRAPLQPANRNLPPYGGSSLAGGSVSNGVRASPAAGSSSSPTCVQGSGRVQPAPQGNGRKDRFTFKKPSDSVSTATSKVAGKCSAAEIELKKQQAMERRRRRLQAAQNLGAPA